MGRRTSMVRRMVAVAALAATALVLTPPCQTPAGSHCAPDSASIVTVPADPDCQPAGTAACSFKGCLTTVSALPLPTPVADEARPDHTGPVLATERFADRLRVGPQTPPPRD